MKTGTLAGILNRTAVCLPIVLIFALVGGVNGNEANHSHFIKRDGSLWGAGNNSKGQLEDADANFSFRSQDGTSTAGSEPSGDIGITSGFLTPKSFGPMSSRMTNRVCGSGGGSCADSRRTKKLISTPSPKAAGPTSMVNIMACFFFTIIPTSFG